VAQAAAVTNTTPGLERYPHTELHLDLGVELHVRADRLSLAYRRLLADFVAG
jgi:hypothetical protein